MTMILQDDDTLSVVNNLAPVAPTGYKTTIVPYALMLAGMQGPAAFNGIVEL